MQLGGSTIPATPNRIIAGSQNREMLSISNIQQEKSASNSRERKETNVNPFPPLQYPCHLPSTQHQFTRKQPHTHNLFPIARKCVSQADGCEGDSKGMATFSFFGHSHGSSTTPMAMAMTIASHSHPYMPHQTHSFLQYEIHFNIRSRWMRGYHPTGISDPEARLRSCVDDTGTGLQSPGLSSATAKSKHPINGSGLPTSLAGCGCSFTH